MGIADFGNPFRFPLSLPTGVGGRICPYRVSVIVFRIVRFLFYISFLVGRSSSGCMHSLDSSISSSAKKKRQIKRLTEMDTPYGHTLPPMPVDNDKGKRKGLPKSAIPIAMLLCNQISSFKRLLFELLSIYPMKLHGFCW